MSALRLNRRAVLRGLGTGGLALALPPLEAMMTGNGLYRAARGDASKPPVRVITFFWPNGAHMEHFTPTTAGADYVLPKALLPFADLKQDLLVITGLANRGAMKGAGDSHEKGRVCFATGVPSPSGRSAGGPSIDQFLGAKLGGATKVPAVAIAGVVGQGGESACAAWAGAGRPVTPTFKPAVLFSTLFTGGLDPTLGAAELTQIRKRRKSVVDFLLRDVTRLDAQLGASDRLRLNAHLEAVRGIERRLASDEGASVTGPAACRNLTPPPAEKSDPWQWTYSGAPLSRHNLLEDIMVLGLHCDVTRYVSVKLSVEIDKWIRKSFPGETRGHHDISHDPRAKEIQSAYTAYQVGFMAQLMAKLKALNDGTSNLLHNTIIYASSEISHGGAHNYTNMPVLVGGHGGGAIKSGRHLNLLPFLDPGKWSGVKSEQWTDLAALFLAIVRAAGSDTPSWGDSTTPLVLG